MGGKKSQSLALEDDIAGTKIVVILRGKSVMLSLGETVLQPGNRLLVVAPPPALAGLGKHLSLSSALNQQAGASEAN
ncbi:MAG: TrkA C-terminal domain-containing protein [Candidatus Acidiferrum sp.]